jgi:hypothetical protein
VSARVALVVWDAGVRLATLLFGLHLTQVFPQTGHDIAPGYGPLRSWRSNSPRGQADLEAIFGFFTDPQQVARLAAMRTGNERDYLYMLLYAGFLASGCIALWRELRLRRDPRRAGATGRSQRSCDAYENWLLFDIQAAFTAGDYSPAMASLPYPVAAKFLFLALDERRDRRSRNRAARPLVGLVRDARDPRRDPDGDGDRHARKFRLGAGPVDRRRLDPAARACGRRKLASVRPQAATRRSGRTPQSSPGRSPNGRSPGAPGVRSPPHLTPCPPRAVEV